MTMKMLLRRLRRALGSRRPEDARRGGTEAPSGARLSVADERGVGRVASFRSGAPASGLARRIPCISEPCPDVRRALETMCGEARLSARDRRVGATQ